MRESLHADFCDNRSWITASGYPVGDQRWSSLPRPVLEYSRTGKPHFAGNQFQ